MLSKMFQNALLCLVFALSPVCFFLRPAITPSALDMMADPYPISNFGGSFFLSLIEAFDAF
jgi:hypothetical protein